MQHFSKLRYIQWLLMFADELVLVLFFIFLVIIFLVIVFLVIVFLVIVFLVIVLFVITLQRQQKVVKCKLCYI